MTEKRKPTHDLSAIKTEFCAPEALRWTTSARVTIRELELKERDVVKIIASLTREHFDKSMTNYHDHTTWQDVYKIDWHDLGLLYVKFGRGADGYILISLHGTTS